MVCFYACLAVAIWLFRGRTGLQVTASFAGCTACFGSVGSDICTVPSDRGVRGKEKRKRSKYTFLVVHGRVDAFCYIVKERVDCIFICGYCIRKEGLRQEHTAILIVV